MVKFVEMLLYATVLAKIGHTPNIELATEVTRLTKMFHVQADSMSRAFNHVVEKNPHPAILGLIDEIVQIEPGFKKGLLMPKLLTAKDPDDVLKSVEEYESEFGPSAETRLAAVNAYIAKGYEENEEVIKKLMSEVGKDEG